MFTSKKLQFWNSMPCEYLFFVAKYYEYFWNIYAVRLFWKIHQYDACILPPQKFLVVVLLKLFSQMCKNVCCIFKETDLMHEDWGLYCLKREHRRKKIFHLYASSVKAKLLQVPVFLHCLETNVLFFPWGCTRMPPWSVNSDTGVIV